MKKLVIALGSLVFVLFVVALLPQQSCAGYKDQCSSDITPTETIILTETLPIQLPSLGTTDTPTITDTPGLTDTPTLGPTSTPSDVNAASGGYTDDHLGCGEHSCAPAQEAIAPVAAPNTGRGE